jgi:hypothetical protein
MVFMIASVTDMLVRKNLQAGNSTPARTRTTCLCQFCRQLQVNRTLAMKSCAGIKKGVNLAADQPPVVRGQCYNNTACTSQPGSHEANITRTW